VNGDISAGVRPEAARSSAGRLEWFAFVLLFALPWLDPFAGGPSSSVNPWLFSALCTALVYALRGAAQPKLAVLLALAGISVWAFLVTGLSLETVALAGACLLIFMAAAAATRAAQDRDLAVAIATAWLLAAAVSTAIALFQYFDAADRLAPWVNAASVGEAFANLRQRNQFASLTVIGMASVLCLSRQGLRPWFAISAMVWLAVGNAATTSRTGLMQMLLLALLACAWPAPRRERLMLWCAGLLAYAMAALALPWLLELTTGVAGNRLWERVAAVDACSSRTVLWRNVLELIAQKPWTGWGWGNLDYAHYLTLYPGARFCDILDNAHNLPLHLAVELGVPAVVVVCAGLLWAISRVRPLAEIDSRRQMAWGVLAVIGIHSLLEYPLWYGQFQVTFGLCLGLLWPEASPRVERAPGLARAVAVATAAAMIAACAYAGWDYRRVSQIYLPPDARVAGAAQDPLPEIRKSWLFRNQASFAELTITPLTRANAQWTFHTAAAMLRYSPEPRVIEKLIESATLLGREDEALLHLARFRAAFPDAYAKWSQTQAAPGAHRPTKIGPPAT
jgi:O-antigen ligase